ncbi:hypothetical protein [Mycobacterium kyogaense]|uniref:hypothetical protein n=1 Tax=Mycobacterium kyogaense TaxID=2212479 RepID=UPI0013C46F4B|nr:hypothetical protein [Mycobacterium kyogaense]
MLELHAHRLVAHGLEQCRHGQVGMSAALAEVDEADVSDVFAIALGVLFRAIDGDSAAELVTRVRAEIPALIAETEGMQQE